ncbi:hypothetical protein C5167_034466 [Papaver somniferum]|uniref:Uncharacterized protein n=1 Tax=Papaver somniferum TaxID=3469 RepID=A0A4Y7KH37_PAPSO|nr:hypothetical protein C5167_034466 [Papaver somniferum]
MFILQGNLTLAVVKLEYTTMRKERPIDLSTPSMTLIKNLRMTTYIRGDRPVLCEKRLYFTPSTNVEVATRDNHGVPRYEFQVIYYSANYYSIARVLKCPSSYQHEGVHVLKMFLQGATCTILSLPVRKMHYGRRIFKVLW